MVALKLKKDFNKSELETGNLCLGHEKIDLIFNVGPFPGGEDCLIVQIGGEIDTINSKDLIHDLDAYEIAIE